VCGEAYVGRGVSKEVMARGERGAAREGGRGRGRLGRQVAGGRERAGGRKGNTLKAASATWIVASLSPCGNFTSPRSAYS